MKINHTIRLVQGIILLGISRNISGVTFTAMSLHYFALLTLAKEELQKIGNWYQNSN